MWCAKIGYRDTSSLTCPEQSNSIFTDAGETFRKTAFFNLIWKFKCSGKRAYSIVAVYKLWWIFFLVGNRQLEMTNAI
jgi:hypothetical protein